MTDQTLKPLMELRRAFGHTTDCKLIACQEHHCNCGAVKRQAAALAALDDIEHMFRASIEAAQVEMQEQALITKHEVWTDSFDELSTAKESRVYPNGVDCDDPLDAKRVYVIDADAVDALPLSTNALELDRLRTRREEVEKAPHDDDPCGCWKCLRLADLDRQIAELKKS